jgi:UDP-N-acetylmuramoylalanine--D-glutamate ligase
LTMMIPRWTAGKTYAVLGLGKSGLATAQSLLAAGAHVLAWDDHDASRKAALALGIPLTDLNTIDWLNVTALVMSPGIPHSFPAPHPVAAAAKAAGIPLTSDISLLLHTQPAARTVGITGTNGKSTTTTLIGHILQHAGKTIAVGGNLGTPVLTFPALDADGIYVLELSSYQLELMEENPLTIGLLLNITPDHLDRHGGMAGYCAAKRRIIRQSGAQNFICGLDDAECRSIAHDAAQQSNLTLTTISQHDNPAATIHVHQRQLMVAGQPVLSLDSLPRLVGAHNWQNVAAAYAACHALGIEHTTIITAMQSFPGLDHRQQWVGAINNVQFINDSKGTNADATAKALTSFSPIYWIAGGLPKEGGLNGLEPLMPHIRHAFLIGQAAPAFGAWLEGKVPVTQSGTLALAVEQATTLALQDNLPHATVLLSPACASWDQFKNFEERGTLFTQLVQQRLALAGQTP